jgi:hypothetical protein
MHRVFARWACRLAATVAALALSAPVAHPAFAESAPDCQFVLGFATMRDLVGPATVGDCLANQQFSAQTGDAFQPTSQGMLVWRHADNWTAFTDGHMTWLNGPFGLERRPNTERLPWEADTTPANEPAPSPSDGGYAAVSAPSPSESLSTPSNVPAQAIEEDVPPAPSLEIAGQTIVQLGKNVWITGELRNHGPGIAYGYVVKALFWDQWGNAIASGQYSMSSLVPKANGAPIAPGESAPFKIVVGVAEFARVEVTVGPNKGAIGPGRDGAVRTIPVQDLMLTLENKSGTAVAHGTGVLKNDTQRLFRGTQVLVWFLDGNGQVFDQVLKSVGVKDIELGALVLRPGQPAKFDLTSANSKANSAIAGIKAVKAIAFAQETDLP